MDDEPQEQQFLISARLLSTVQSKRVQYIWPGRLAEGMLSLIDGDPGSGKTTAALDIAARVTTGDPFPGETERREPRSVILLSAEDSAEQTLRPRMEAAGADLARVLLIDKQNQDGAAINIVLPDDLFSMNAVMSASDVALVIIDPLMAYLSGELNSNSDQDVRRALAPLMAMAERWGCAVLMIRHMNKGVGASPMYRGGGSIGVIGAARFAFVAARDPDDPTGLRRVLAPVKINVGPEPPALAYTLESVEGMDVAKVEWHGEITMSAAKLVMAAKSEAEQNAIKDAVEWLRDQLKVSGAKPVTEVRSQATKDGFTWDEIKTAIGVEGIRRRRSDAPPNDWLLHYPDGAGTIIRPGVWED